MASTSFVHFAIFASGAVLGAGAVAAVSSHSTHRPTTEALPTNSKSKPSTHANQRECGAWNGSLEMVEPTAQPVTVLKYGNPGMF